MIKIRFNSQARPKGTFFIGMIIVGLICICWALINILHERTLLRVATEDIYMDESVTLLKNYPLKGDDIGSSIVGAIASNRVADIVTDLNPNSIMTSIEDNTITLTTFSVGDRIGKLNIPVLNLTLPIIEGTDEDSLKKGVGHYSQSVLPGEADNCVLSGHRETVFAKLGKVAIGDLLIITSEAGTFTYKVSTIRIVDAQDRTVIVPSDSSVLTLTTCYPFQYIGSAKQRYIVSADLIIEE